MVDKSLANQMDSKLWEHETNKREPARTSISILIVSRVCVWFFFPFSLHQLQNRLTNSNFFQRLHWRIFFKLKQAKFRSNCGTVSKLGSCEQENCKEFKRVFFFSFFYVWQISTTAAHHFPRFRKKANLKGGPTDVWIKKLVFFFSDKKNLLFFFSRFFRLSMKDHEKLLKKLCWLVRC